MPLTALARPFPGRPLVALTRRLPEGVEARLAELFDLRRNEADAPLDADALAALAAEADVLVPTVTDRVDAALIARAGPRLKLIASFGNGTDHLDVAAAHARGITCTNTPGVLTDDVADVAMALIVDVARRVTEGSRIIPAGGFAGWSPGWMLGRRLAGRRLGIVGMGRIGQALARRARAFGLQVHYHNRRPLPQRAETELGATYWDSLDRMLARVDVVSIHCPRTPATYHLLSARRLALLQPHAILVNTARGGVVDEEALAERLEAGLLAGAGLDVFEQEPHVSPRLVKLAEAGRAVLLPHMSSATVEGRLEMGERVIINVKTFADGHRPPDRVLPPLD